VNQVDVSIARLRLFLADIDRRERDLRTLRRQFREQMERVITFALYREPSVEQTLTMMGDVDQRGQTVEQSLQYLGHLRARVEAELESLQLTKGIEAAKLELAELEARRAEVAAAGLDEAAGPQDADGTPTLEELTAEIRRLQALINEASERAVQTLLRRGTASQPPGSTPSALEA
jgi:hypothetical protein